MAVTVASPNNEAWLNSDRAEKVPYLLARRILGDMIQRRLAPGDMLPSEASMLEKLGVGRASLREALRILEIHGLVRIKPGARGGPVVTDVTGLDYGRTTSLYLYRAGATYRDLLEARVLMEPLMARLAAQRLTPEAADRIRGVLKTNREMVELPPEDWPEAIGHSFHMVIAGASGNGVLDLYSCGLVAIFGDKFDPLFPIENRRDTLEIHDRIAQAILGREPTRAEELATVHMIELSSYFEDRLLDSPVEWS